MDKHGRDAGVWSVRPLLLFVMFSPFRLSRGEIPGNTVDVSFLVMSPFFF